MILCLEFLFHVDRLDVNSDLTCRYNYIPDYLCIYFPYSILVFSCFKRRLQGGDDSSGSASGHIYGYKHSTGRVRRQ